MPSDTTPEAPGSRDGSPHDPHFGGGNLSFGVGPAPASGAVTHPQGDPGSKRGPRAPQPAAAPTQTVPSMTIRTGTITIAGGSVTGDVTLTLRKSGVCTLQGTFHNTGVTPVDIEFALVVVSSSGRAFTFTHSCRAAGALSAGTHDATWAESPTPAGIAEDWDALFSDCTYQWRASADVSLLGSVENLVKLIRDQGGNVNSVTPVKQGGDK